jgi:hypothetical protein
MTMRITKGDESIASLADWLRLSPPAGGADQWVEHKSAMSCAQAWLADAATGGPPEVLALLRSHPDFQDVVLDSAEPEVKQVFDRRLGNTRNTDVQVVARDSFGMVAISVEAKAGEPFGETVAEALIDGVEVRRDTPRSTKLDRVDELARSIVPPPCRGTPGLGVLRYQLLTATAGALAWAAAQGARRAVLVVHEFVTPRTSDDQHAQCASDLQAFIRRLSGDPQADCPDGQLVGPFSVPGLPLLDQPPLLYVGKATRRTR